ncbi:MAG TPA: proton-conducting transporter membrane subunit [Verrucomicrobiae bacterium]|nr:proton-conducting transporter membrane subunit [Verrucomicrobiae bacterium]
MAMFGIVVTMLLTLLVAWGLTRRSTPFVATYQYINMSVAFSGPSNFQTFTLQLILHVDHLTVVALLAIEICMMAAIGWHSLMGRTEPGAARFHAVITALLFACSGMLMSWDLAELFGFWAIGGALTYLLLAHRWGLDEAASRARVALALPFLTDLCFLCGIAWLYARYGTQNLSSLVPILHTNPGWTVRSLVVGSVLLFIGIAGRLALWPLTSWITQTAVTAPPAASAIAQSAWSVVAIVVWFRLMPIVVASNQQTLRALISVTLVAAIAAPLLGMLGNEPRRAVALNGSGAVAVAAAVLMNGFQVQSSTFAIVGVAAVLAIAPARAGGVLALASIASAMRTDDLAEMGEAWRRLRASAGALLVTAAVMAVADCGALAFGVKSRSFLGFALGEAVLLVAVGGLRIYLAASFGPLRRRRAFEPERVRQVEGALGWPYLLAIAGAGFLVASLFAGWLNFLDGQKHPAASVGAILVWAGVAIVGIAIAAVSFVRGKDGALAASAAGGAWVHRSLMVAFAGIDRFLIRPTTDIARRLEDWVPAGDSALGRFTSTSGQLALAAGRVPALPIVIVLAVALAIVFAIVAPGVAR